MTFYPALLVTSTSPALCHEEAERSLELQLHPAQMLAHAETANMACCNLSSNANSFPLPPLRPHAHRNAPNGRAARRRRQLARTGKTRGGRAGEAKGGGSKDTAERKPRRTRAVATAAATQRAAARAWARGATAAQQPKAQRRRDGMKRTAHGRFRRLLPT